MSILNIFIKDDSREPLNTYSAQNYRIYNLPLCHHSFDNFGTLLEHETVNFENWLSSNNSLWPTKYRKSINPDILIGLGFFKCIFCSKMDNFGLPTLCNRDLYSFRTFVHPCFKNGRFKIFQMTTKRWK